MMMKFTRFLLLGCMAMFVASCQPITADESQHSASGIAAPVIAETGIAYPDGYETAFENYLSLDRVQNHDQTIRLFANDIAMQGPDESGLLPFGSVLVAEVYKAVLDESGEVMVSALGRRIRGDMALVAVMERREGFGADLPEGLKNEQWEFATFKPDGSLADKDLNACRACHAPLTETHHLFSFEHIAKTVSDIPSFVANKAEEMMEGEEATEEPIEEPAAEVAEGAVVIDVLGNDTLRFDPDALEVESGAQVSLNFASGSAVGHQFVLLPKDTDTTIVNTDDAVDGIDTGLVAAGESTTIAFTAPDVGGYQYVCAVPGHAAAGMVGTLTVTEASE